MRGGDLGRAGRQLARSSNFLGNLGDVSTTNYTICCEFMDVFDVEKSLLCPVLVWTKQSWAWHLVALPSPKGDDRLIDNNM